MPYTVDIMIRKGNKYMRNNWQKVKYNIVKVKNLIKDFLRLIFLENH